MPYIETPDENILFIHIPKAGGSSIEDYLKKNIQKILNYEDI